MVFAPELKGYYIIRAHTHPSLPADRLILHEVRAMSIKFCIRCVFPVVCVTCLDFNCHLV